jgi:hypothetical protein
VSSSAFADSGADAASHNAAAGGRGSAERRCRAAGRHVPGKCQHRYRAGRHPPDHALWRELLHQRQLLRHVRCQCGKVPCVGLATRRPRGPSQSNAKLMQNAALNPRAGDPPPGRYGHRVRNHAAASSSSSAASAAATLLVARDQRDVPGRPAPTAVCLERDDTRVRARTASLRSDEAEVHLPASQLRSAHFRQPGDGSVPGD